MGKWVEGSTVFGKNRHAHVSAGMTPGWRGHDILLPAVVGKMVNVDFSVSDLVVAGY